MRGILGISLSLLSATAAQGAVVKKINAQKRIVILDEGSKAGFLKKKKVCFYDAEQVKVACGRVRAVKAKSSSIQIKKDKDLEKITIGMTANIENSDNKSVKITIDEEAAAAPAASYKAPHYIGLFGSFPLVDPVSYQNLVYHTPLAADTTSMWEQDSPVKSVGIGGELGFGIKGFTLALGARMRTYSPKQVSSDYDNKDGDQVFEEFVESTGKGSALGLWLDFYYLHWDWDVVSLNLGNGIDMDNSQASFVLNHGADNTEVVTRYYDVKSKLQATSLRTALLLDFKFGPVGFKMGTVIFVPLAEKQKLTVEQNDPFTLQYLKGKTPEEDLKEKLTHKSKVGAELLLMGYFAY